MIRSASSPAVAVTTAGLRGAHWKGDILPAGVALTAHSLKTADGATVTGYLFRRGGESSVVCAMHPREVLITHYLVPEVLAAGCAMWVLSGRSAGNDLRLEHESALLDLAAGQQFLASQGYKSRILLGTSGGGPLAAFYVQQSFLAPNARITRSPGGRATRLDQASMPPPCGLILVSAHLGQGKVLLKAIDPSVVDEANPLGTDERLSIFNPANGFKEPPQSSRYSADFLADYKQAQVRRVERLDKYARQIIERRTEARGKNLDDHSPVDRLLAVHSPIFTVWRTDADPRCFDLGLEPSERAYGSLWGPNPLSSNFGSVGFARVCTAEGWLSNWSGLSSNAVMEKCGPDVYVPTLVVQYGGDNSVFPSEADELFALIGSKDKTRVRLPGNHHGMPIQPGMPDGQPLAGQAIRAWVEDKRFTGISGGEEK